MSEQLAGPVLPPPAPGPAGPPGRAGRIAHAFSVQLVCRVLGMIASLVSVAMTARYLGPTLYGQLTIAIVFIGMWTSLADLGIGTVIVRRVTSGRGHLERLVRVSGGLSVVYCVPLTLLAAGVGLLVYPDPDVQAMLVVLSSTLLLMTMTARFEPVFMTTVRFTAVALSDLASRLGMLTAVAYLVHTGADVVWFAAAQLIPPALQLAIQGVAAARHVSLWPVFSLREVTSLLVESRAQMGVVIIAILYWRTDGVILSLVSDASEVGVYGLAYIVAFNTVVLSTFFLKSTLSTATELFARDVAAFTGFLRRSVEMMIYLGVPLAVLGTVLAGPVIAALGSSEFVERGAPTLALLLVAVALRFVTGTLGQGLFAAHQQGYLFRLSVATLALNVVLNVALAVQFGAVGAAASLVMTEVFGLVVASLRLRRTTGYRTPWTALAKVLPATAAAAATALVLSGQPLPVSGGAALAVFAAANLVVGPIRLSQLAALRGRSRS